MDKIDQVQILLAEDNSRDAEMTIRTLKKHGISVHWVKDGQETLDFLLCEGTYGHRRDLPLPKLLLLDIKMPKLDGLDVLRRMKLDEKLRTVPTVVMTSSEQQPDVEHAYRLGANSYIVKPVQFDAFTKVVAKIGLYWVIDNRVEPPR